MKFLLKKRKAPLSTQGVYTRTTNLNFPKKVLFKGPELPRTVSYV
jgi:hypothetical protein